MAFATSSITGAFASFIYFVCRAGSIYEERSTGLQGRLCRTSSRFSRITVFYSDSSNDFFHAMSAPKRVHELSGVLPNAITLEVSTLSLRERVPEGRVRAGMAKHFVATALTRRVAPPSPEGR